MTAQWQLLIQSTNLVMSEGEMKVWIVDLSSNYNKTQNTSELSKNGETLLYISDTLRC